MTGRTSPTVTGTRTAPLEATRRAAAAQTGDRGRLPGQPGRSAITDHHPQKRQR